MNNINSTGSNPNPYFYPSSEEDSIDNSALKGREIDVQPEFQENHSEIQSLQEINLEQTIQEINQLNTEERDNLISKVVQNKTLTFQQTFQTLDKLTLNQAKKLVQDIIRGKTVNFLSPINLLFFEMIKVMQQLSRERTIASFSGFITLNIAGKPKTEQTKGSEIVQHLSGKLHLLFRIFRDYSGLLEGKIAAKANRIEIIQAQQIYLKIVNLFVRIEGVIQSEGNIQTKKLGHELKKYCNVLYHVCFDEDFLKICTQSLSPNMDPLTSVITYPPTLSHMNLYLDSLDTCLYSLVQFHSKIQKDYQDPLINAVEQISKFPKEVFALLPLDDLIGSIREFLNDLSGIMKEFPVAVQKIIISSKLNKANLPLKACFKNLKEENTSLMIALKQMHPMVEEISVPWNSFNKGMEERSSLMVKFIKTASEKVSNKIDHMEKALKTKKINKRTRIQIRSLLTGITSSTSSSCFFKIYNAFVIESMRLPMLINQEMALFFSVMNEKNLLALKFHRSLILSESKLPSSSFSAIDLFIHQVFQCSELSIQNSDDAAFGEMIRLVTQKILPKFIYTLKVLQSVSPVIKLSISKKNDLREDLLSLLNLIVDTLNETLNLDLSEPTALQSRALRVTIPLLHKYLENSENFDCIRRHLIVTLLDPISTQHEISSFDLPLIQQHMKLISVSADQYRIDRQFLDLENEIKKKLVLASDISRFFWKRNLKYVILAKLEIAKRQNIFRTCSQQLQICTSCDEVLLTLHEYKKKMQSTFESYDAWSSQLTVLGTTGLRSEDEKIIEITSVICLWDSWIDFLNLTIFEIVSQNPAPKKHSLIRTGTPDLIFNSPDSHSSDETDGEAEIKEISLSMLPQATYQPSPFEETSTLLNTLKAQMPPLLNAQEPIDSYIFRLKKREELIQNLSFYQALIEDAKKGNHPEQNVPELISKREQLDQILSFEATQKVALIYLRIGTKESLNTHIINSIYHGRSLIYTHNGELLTQLIFSADKHWFENSDDQSTIVAQEFLLKKVYWFQEDHQMLQGTTLITSTCERVWRDLSILTKSPKGNCLENQVTKFQDCHSRIYKLRRNQFGSLIPVSDIQNVDIFYSKITKLITALQVNPQCANFFQDFVSTVKRVMDFNQTLNVYVKTVSRPLFFTMRSAEIQVSLLSSILKIALSTVKPNASQPHPLFLDHEGKDQDRPLLYSHRVDRLWEVLKDHLGGRMDADTLKMLDASIPLFVGDPRYPHPNKTAMTNNLVNMHQKDYLFKKIESERMFNKEDIKLLNKHLGKESWKLHSQFQKAKLKEIIAQDVEEQKKKTHLVLQMSEMIIKSVQ
ncbi:MAG: hypothetical protein H0T62_11385 [Parachlamydiaceae bacterium]|nr:hypothetical protein [Parachlamydiaceae bacterium]